eukprot:TRINITY_DN5525_c0_g1_i5.p1 TRINITY_DN5525_c0_g1~~TRINITY_DN5525_c0_g1_i5.p1  ORF type:complete len:471 (-),score=59.27 TRINITY_DN5525_c0_g1_i5:669-1958(-)
MAGQSVLTCLVLLAYMSSLHGHMQMEQFPALDTSKFPYSRRDTVKVGHSAPVQLEDGRTVNVVTLSDDSTGIPAFQIDDFLTEKECDFIKGFGAKDDQFEESVAGSGAHLENLKRLSKEEVDDLFNNTDDNQDGVLDAQEIAKILRVLPKLMSDYYNHSEMIDVVFGARQCKVQWGQEKCQSAGGKSDPRTISRSQFPKVNWGRYLKWVRKHHPTRFLRSSKTLWLPDYKHEVLKILQKNIAAVTGLPLEIVKKRSQEMQLLKYEPGGHHYSCHHDPSWLQAGSAFRFMTFYLYLSDVKEGGETILYNTNLSASSKDRDYAARPVSLMESVASEEVCSSTTSFCPKDHSENPGHPYENTAFVRPKLGRAFFWYNADVTPEGRGTRFRWGSMHGGCPTKGDTKWGANVWIEAGPADQGWEDPEGLFNDSE